jgi:hypothetical protein
MPADEYDRPCRGPVVSTVRSFYLNDDLLGAIAQAALIGADVATVWPRYHTRKHHWSAAFRAWRPINFNEGGIGDERLRHGFARLGQAGAQNSQSPATAKKGR